jgi:tRNA 2-selenouridine synthase
MAWLLSFYGFDVFLLEGGYKSYRHWVLQQLNLPFQFQALGGYTGSGKTEVLQALKHQGLPVIDLEDIAQHKGSAFGNLGLRPQPSQEYFENLLVAELTSFYAVDSNGNFIQPYPIWIENESRRIGLINLTDHFYHRMQSAPLYTIEIPFEQRLDFITKGYGHFEREKLVNAIIRIQKRLGGLDTKNAINFLLENQTLECFRILLQYYDKHYLQSMKDSNRNAVSITAMAVDPAQNAKLLLENLTQTIKSGNL